MKSRLFLAVLMNLIGFSLSAAADAGIVNGFPDLLVTPGTELNIDLPTYTGCEFGPFTLQAVAPADMPQWYSVEGDHLIGTVPESFGSGNQVGLVISCQKRFTRTRPVFITETLDGTKTIRVESVDEEVVEKNQSKIDLQME